jgi:hypothetical protein
MSKVSHITKITHTRTLEDIADEVYEEIDRMALKVGRLLREAQELAPGEFRKWVEESLPFGIDTARRLVAIHLSYEKLSESQLKQLPHPWQALYALRKHVDGKLPEALASGEIGTHTTQAEAIRKAREWSRDERTGVQVADRYGAADLTAGRLMTFEPSELKPDVLRALRRWINRS